MTNNGYTLEMSKTSAPLTGTYNGSLLLFGVRSLQKLYLACSLYRHCAPGHKLFTDICAIIDSGNLIRDNHKFSVKLVEEELKKTLSKTVHNDYEKLDLQQKKAIYDIVSCDDLELKNAIKYINRLLPVEIGKEEYNSLTLGHGYNGESRYRYVLEEPQNYFDKLKWYFTFVIQISIVCDFERIPKETDLTKFIETTVDSYLTKYNFKVLDNATTIQNEIKTTCLNYLYLVFGYRISRLPVYLQKGLNHEDPVLVYVTKQNFSPNSSSSSKPIGKASSVQKTSVQKESHQEQEQLNALNFNREKGNSLLLKTKQKSDQGQGINEPLRFDAFNFDRKKGNSSLQSHQKQGLLNASPVNSGMGNSLLPKTKQESDQGKKSQGVTSAPSIEREPYYFYRKVHDKEVYPTIPFSNINSPFPQLDNNFKIEPAVKIRNNSTEYSFSYHEGEWNYFTKKNVKYTNEGHEFCYHGNHWCYSKPTDRLKRRYYGNHPLPECPLPQKPKDDPIQLTPIDQIIVTCVFFRKIMTMTPSDSWDTLDIQNMANYQGQNNFLTSSSTYDNPLIKEYKKIVDSICPCGDETTKIDSIIASKANGVYQQFYVMEVIFKKYSIGLKYVFDILKQMLISMKDYYLLLKSVRQFITMK